MPPKKTPPPAAQPAKKFPIAMSTMIAAAVLIPVGYFAYTSYVRWSGVRGRDQKFENSFATLAKENGELRPVYEATQLKKYQICNKSSETVTVHWLTAAYHDGKQVKVFDSSRCRDWQEPVFVPGDSRFVVLRSSQTGCNWDGSVMQYAMRYTLESEDKFNILNVVGPYRGFDRDCYTIQ